MRVYCQCGSASSVRRSDPLSTNATALYCSCCDPECGHSFVSEMGFKHTLELPKKVQETQLSGYAQGGRVYCGCGSRAVIQKTNRLSTNVADLYCHCQNCGHRFVMALAYSHTLSPSARTTDELTIALIRSLTPDRRLALQSQLSLF
ncbi:transcriptional regulator [Photobacterium halotolerans]|nr:transcriptional regulator [Photobacterium halotolerans]